MDKVRLGRVLGIGARQAARTLVDAAEAAAAPSPHPRSQPRPTNAPPVATRTAPTLEGLKRGSAAARAASGGVTAPLRRFSAVLWLEVTGAFFALLATTFGIASWRTRAGFLHASAPALQHRAWIFTVLFAVFAYFSLSSFLRAARRGRR